MTELGGTQALHGPVEKLTFSQHLEKEQYRGRSRIRIL